jgi:UDP-N-acetylglucosamine 2-epimerase
MRVATIVGARPQFVKAAPLSAALAGAGHEELLIHTGQHYDAGMSDVFFAELPIAPPSVNLGVGSGAAGWQVAEVLRRSEEVLRDAKPDWVVVYGDTNSTLGGALAAKKSELRLAHVEAGLRSWNRAMPEEDNRVLTDHASDLLLCPTPTAMRNLAREGLAERALHVGDTMYDAVREFLPLARARSRVLEAHGLRAGEFAVATVHRNYNADDPAALSSLLAALACLEWPVVFPVHPRTRKKIAELPGAPLERGALRPIDPVSYLDMLVLEADARVVLTDSGGMQKEAMFLGTPCVTLRPETEWLETVELGWNVLAGTDPERIRAAAATAAPPRRSAQAAFGDGHAARAIVRALEERR